MIFIMILIYKFFYLKGLFTYNDIFNSLISKINSLDLNTEQYIEIYKIVKKIK